MERDKPHPHLISFPACASLPPICPSIFLHPPTLHMHPTLFFLAGSAARMSDMAAHIQSSDCYEQSQGMRVGDVQCSAVFLHGGAVHSRGSGWVCWCWKGSLLSSCIASLQAGPAARQRRGPEGVLVPSPPAPILWGWFIQNLATWMLKADHYYSLLRKDFFPIIKCILCL